MKPAAYLETSVISYLAARPSRDLLIAAHQQITHDWWHYRREDFDLFASQLVIDESESGDQEAANRRTAVLSDLPLLDITPEVITLAQHLVQAVPLAPRAAPDALHIAVAVCHGIDYLLTWNCAHIANAELRPRIDKACRKRGYAPTVLCTPDELMGGHSDV